MTKSFNHKMKSLFSCVMAIILIVGCFTFSISAAELSESSSNNTRSTTISEGTFYIQNITSDRYITPNTGGLLNTSTHVEQWNYDYDRNQAWDIISDGNGYYKIKNIVDGTYLTSPESTSSGEKITSEAVSTAQPDRQLWSFSAQTDGTYQIKAKNRYSYVISSNANNAINGGNIVQRPATDGDVTKWTLIPWTTMHSDAYLHWGLATPSVTLLLANTTANNSTWQPIIKASAAAWNSSGAGATIALKYSGSSNHEIYVSAVAETWYGAAYPDSLDSGNNLLRSHIVINTNTSTTATAQSTIVHEIGHVLHLDDNPSMTDDTIMSYARDRETMKVPQLYDIYNVKNFYN